MSRVPQIIAQRKKKKISRRKLRKALNAWQVYENLRTFTEGHMHFFIGFEFPYNERFLFWRSVVIKKWRKPYFVFQRFELRYISIVELKLYFYLKV